MDWRMNYDDVLLERVAMAHLQDLRAEADSVRAFRAGRGGWDQQRRTAASLRVRLGHMLTAAGAAVAGERMVRHQPEPCGD